MEDARDQFCELLRTAVNSSTFLKLTLGRYRGSEPTLKNLLVRPVELKSGPHLSLVWRHATRDVTKNHPPAAALSIIEPLLGAGFLDAHLFTNEAKIQLACHPGGKSKLTTSKPDPEPTTKIGHDHVKSRPIPPDATWLRTLGVTTSTGRPEEGMAAKFRQIEKFAEILQHLMAETSLAAPLEVVDMGSGKGYLTFAIATVLGKGAHVRGIEARPELVKLCNAAAAQHGLAPELEFTAGTIADTPLDNLDILIALHACDTATDDALARGIDAGANLLIVAPCCQKELRRQLRAPPVLAGALKHGIFQERQAEFITDALRAELLEWAGYRTKAFEFISTEHTAKNIMITAIKTHARGDESRAARVRELAAFYGIKKHALARQLGFLLV
jgi:SAM-dependent methyltransferase